MASLLILFNFLNYSYNEVYSQASNIKTIKMVLEIIEDIQLLFFDIDK